MKTVGIRELKDHLSQYLHDVRRGEVVQITDRGSVVAELRPPARPGAEEGVDWEALRRLGVRVPSRPQDSTLYRRVPTWSVPPRTTRLLIDEGRDET